MKTFMNWRFYVMAALFTGGLLSVGRAFGEPARPMGDTEFVIQFLLSCLFAAICFGTLAALTRHWERNGDMPEF